MGTVNVTLRIEEDEKRTIDEGAKRSNRSLNDFMTRAALEKATGQCPQCGRSNTEATTASVVEAFRKWLAARPANEKATASLITTIEGVHRIAYWVVLREEIRPDEGLLPVLHSLDPGDPTNQRTVRGAIPLTVITGWAWDPHGTEYQKLVTLGYEDGNASARQFYPVAMAAMLAQQQQQQLAQQVRRGRGGR